MSPNNTLTWKANNTAEPAKTNSDTTNEGKKEWPSLPVDSSTSTAASSNGAKQPQQPDAKALVATNFRVLIRPAAPTSDDFPSGRRLG